MQENASWQLALKCRRLSGFQLWCLTKLLPKPIGSKAETSCPPWKSPQRDSLLLSLSSANFCRIHAGLFFGSSRTCRLFPFSGALQGIWQWSANNRNFLNSFPLHCHISSFFRHFTPEKRPELWNSTSLHHIQSLMHTNSASYCFFGHSASQPVLLLCYSSVSTPPTFSETATMPTLPFCPFPFLPRYLMYTTMWVTTYEIQHCQIHL